MKFAEFLQFWMPELSLANRLRKSAINGNPASQAPWRLDAQATTTAGSIIVQSCVQPKHPAIFRVCGRAGVRCS